jgi:hypothetical protein
MKKILTLLLSLVSILVLSGCGRPGEWKQILITSQEEAIEYFRGENSFIYNDDFESYLLFFDPLDVDVYIDGNMSQTLIDVTIEALNQYDDIDGIIIKYEIVTDLPEEYEVLFTTYRDSEEDHCSEDDSDVIACNSLFFDEKITSSTIRYNLDVLEWILEEYPDQYEDYALAIALHEFGHTFGLDDIYNDYMAEVTIMYFADDGGMFTALKDFDIYNLEYMYKTKEDEELFTCLAIIPECGWEFTWKFETVKSFLETPVFEVEPVVGDKYVLIDDNDDLFYSLFIYEELVTSGACEDDPQTDEDECPVVATFGWVEYQVSLFEPLNPAVGNLWYDEIEELLYEYILIPTIEDNTVE